MVKLKASLPDRHAIRTTFDRVADRYDQHAALEREVGERLMERLEFRRRDPQRIIELGSGTGYCSAALKRRFHDAEVIGLDASERMSQALQCRSKSRHPLKAVCADLSLLPFAGRSADLLLSNLALQWCDNFRGLGEGFRRILRPGGLLLFSSLGPDSMKEFKSAAGFDDNPGCARHFTDMHDIGDALLAAGFTEPVMDSERIVIEYPQFDSLVAELEATGADTHFVDWAGQINAGEVLARAYERFRRDGRYPVTWEVIYGTAFGPDEGQPVRTPEGDMAAFSVDYLRGSARRR